MLKIHICFPNFGLSIWGVGNENPQFCVIFRVIFSLSSSPNSHSSLIISQMAQLSLYFLSLKALALGVLCHCRKGTSPIERVIYCCCGSEINSGLTDLPTSNFPLFNLPQSCLSGFKGPSHQITTQFKILQYFPIICKI